MSKSTKSWREKLHTGKEPVVGPTNRKLSGRPPGTLMLVPIPLQIDEIIRRIPRGDFRSAEELKSELARENGAEITCPLCFGMFLRIVSELACEELMAGKHPDEVAPFWRAVPANSPLEGKLAMGREGIDRLRQLDRV